MQPPDVNRLLKQFISERFLDGGDELQDDTPLLEWGVIDSIAMFELLKFIQATFVITIPDAEVSPRNFSSVAELQRLIERLLASKGVDPNA